MRRPTFTEAELKRIIRAARAEDPHAIIEVTRHAIRILPAYAARDERSEKQKRIDSWFDSDDDEPLSSGIRKTAAQREYDEKYRLFTEGKGPAPWPITAG